MLSKEFSLQSEKIQIGDRQIPLYSKEGFELLSELWLKVGWNQRHHYSFKWMGLPILQLPDDLVHLQELIFEVKPDVIIETGVALGGSMLFYGSLVKALGHGRVIGIDVDLRACNRKKIEESDLSAYIALIDGDSSDPATIEKLNLNGERVMVVLDSNHSKQHVAKELELFAPLVSKDSYLIVCDGVKSLVVDVPRGKEHWREDNPCGAIEPFLREHGEFELCEEHPVTHLQGGILKRV
ncbi:MAG: hypothetical protein S4CHLAM81_02900 [Chlamydiales bacterium]|nr:hypothetical protein [Chlamydiales bacterium]MCH9635081.1 hypothetical protein [Chlamydiales bacterium]MCH9703490.1 cephalosporin hydroxylase family protein [Chlamydiota bacterium]